MLNPMGRDKGTLLWVYIFIILDCLFLKTQGCDACQISSSVWKDSFFLFFITAMFICPQFNFLEKQLPMTSCWII